MDTTVYVVGWYVEGDGWELEAVYATEAEALAACDEPDMFYAPMVVGHRYETSKERRARRDRGEPAARFPCVYPRN